MSSGSREAVDSLGDSNRPVVIERSPERAPLSQRGRQRYDDLVRAAARVFRRKGYESATMQDVAAEVGMRTGTIYHYVTGKEDLLFAVIQTFHAGTERIITQLGAEFDRDPVELLETFIRRHVLELTNNSDSGAVFNNDFRSLTGDHRAEVIRQRKAFEDFLRRILEEGQRQGVLRPHSVRLAAMAILGMVNAILNWYRPDGPNSPEEIADDYVHLVVDGLADPTNS